MNKLFFLSLNLFFLALCSCATNSYFLLKNHHFDTPQTHGKDKRFTLSLSPYQNYTTAVAWVTYDDATPELSYWQLTKNSSNMGGATETPGGVDASTLLFDVALNEKIDVSVDFPIGDQPLFVNAKVQVVGSSLSNAKPNEFVVSAVAGIGSISRENDDISVDPRADVIIGAFSDKASFEGYALRAGFSVGMTMDPANLLIYLSNSYTYSKTDLDYSRTISGTKESFQATFKGDQFLSMLGLQYMLGEHFLFNIEGGLAMVNSEDAEKENYGSYGLKMGYIF